MPAARRTASMFSQMRSASFSRLGRPACGARSASTSGAMPFLKSCAMTPVANTQRPALMPCANFTLPAPSSTGSNGSAFLSVIQSSPCSSPGSIALLRRRGKIGPDFDSGVRSTHYRSSEFQTERTDEICAAMGELDRDVSCRDRHRLGPGGELSEPHHHRGGAVPGRRPDRRADAPCRVPAAGQDRSAGCHRKPHRRFRHDRRSLCRARHAGRLHAACQFDRRCAEHPLHAADLPSGG